jgi:DNA polymerase I-like protein with 3'-5' exonuclease and polymerase domains
MTTRGASEENTFEMLAASRKTCVLVTREQAIETLNSMGDEIALDFETTSLHPRNGRVRLTSIRNASAHILIDHDLCGPLENFVPLLGGKIIWVFMSKFESKWLDAAKAKIGDVGSETWLRVRDVDHLAKAVIGGHRSSLAIMAKRDLKILLDKTEQNSNWGDPRLSDTQLDYAGFDSYVTWELVKHWQDRASPVQDAAAEKIFDYCVRGTTECEETGLELDRDLHAETVDVWKMKYATFERYLRKLTPESAIANLNSDLQIGKYLAGILPSEVIEQWPRTEKTKRMQFEGAYIRSISRQFNYPFSRWLAALAGYKFYGKYLSTYGDKLLDISELTGEIHSRFNIGLAKPGRYSSSKENLQNIPRKPVVRRAFATSDPERRLMCLADYKGVEVRALSEVVGDDQLRHDCVYGDVHSASCAAIYDYDYEWVMEVIASKGEGKHGNSYGIVKERRSKAKIFTFRLLYGAGVISLSDVLKCTTAEAEAALEAWASRYPKAFNYRNIIFEQMMETNGVITIWDGRTVFVHKDERTIPVAANYGVQGVAASVMCRAVGRVHRQFIDNDIPAWLAAPVHDELLCYSETRFAEEAMEAQLAGMTDAWLDIFPGTTTDHLLDWAIGTSWADKP